MAELFFHPHLQELNVRSLVLADDDSKYGVRLQAEPDFDRLGKRLKGELKKVSPAIRGMPACRRKERLSGLLCD